MGAGVTFRVRARGRFRVRIKSYLRQFVLETRNCVRLFRQLQLGFALGLEFAIVNRGLCEDRGQD